jgi:hypothetical protein
MSDCGDEGATTLGQQKYTKQEYLNPERHTAPQVTPCKMQRSLPPNLPSLATVRES